MQDSRLHVMVGFPVVQASGHSERKQRDLPPS